MTRTAPSRAALALGLALLLAGACSQAAEPQGRSVKQHAVKHKVAKPRFETGSAETVSERERRLYRECRGRPNAGACEGYAR